MRPAPGPLSRAAAVAAVIAFSGAIYKVNSDSGPSRELEYRADTVSTSTSDRLDLDFLCHPCGTPQIHAPALVETARGELVAVWYGGAREGAGDVAIYLSRRAAVGGSWSEPKPVFSRAQAAAALDRHIKKLGNPVLGRDVRGRLWLVFVSVSAGGWSGSALNLSFSEDDGASWSSPVRLVTSPFFNVSTLVKGAPLALKGGGMAIPVYHELAGKYSEWLVVNDRGKVVNKRRISRGRTAIQPSVAATGAGQVVALMRDTGSAHRIYRSVSADDGQSWIPIAPTALSNPDAAVAVVPVAGNSLLLVFNDAESGRRNLALAISHDAGVSWKKIRVLESAPDTGATAEFSYPYAITASNGDVHIVYTWNRTAVRHVKVGARWIEANR